MIIDKKCWKKCIKNNKDPYGKAAVDVARETMKLLDDGKHEIFDASKIIGKADNNLDEGITGFQAGCIANIIVHCHSKGKKFKKSWNEHYALREEDKKRKGVINPALLTIKVRD